MTAEAVKVFVVEPIWNRVSASTGDGASTLVIPKPPAWARPLWRTPTATPGVPVFFMTDRVKSASSSFSRDGLSRGGEVLAAVATIGVLLERRRSCHPARERGSPHPSKRVHAGAKRRHSATDGTGQASEGELVWPRILRSRWRTSPASWL